MRQTVSEQPAVKGGGQLLRSGFEGVHPSLNSSLIGSHLEKVLGHDFELSLYVVDALLDLNDCHQSLLPDRFRIERLGF